MGFRSLQHTTGLRVHFPRALPARYVPPSGFGYPLDGFLPSVPRRFCFNPAALMGFTLRSVLLPKGTRALPPECTHLPFRQRINHTAEATWSAPQAAVPGIRPFRKSLATGHVFSVPGAGCSPGFPLRGHTGDGLDRDFARSPLSRFTRRSRRPRGTVAPPVGATEYRSAVAWPHSDL